MNRSEANGRLWAVRLLLGAFMLGWAFFFSLTVSALELWAHPDTSRYAELNTTLKLTGLAAYNHADFGRFSERRSATAIARARFSLNARLSDAVSAEAAYEQYLRRTTADGTAGLGNVGLAAFAPAPWRVAKLNWQIAGHKERFAWRQEVDRALITVQPGWGTVTLGRQAIGFGRGMLFSAVDVFAPFSPVEVDREWRRGVDALRIEYRTTALSALELTAVFGDRWDNSALLGRFRGYAGDIDGELIVGKRARDAMFAAVMSTILGGAALHGELALFHTPEDQPDGGLFGRDNLVGKAVLGASYTFNVGDGLTVMAEYHYSGFGMKDVKDALRRFRDPHFMERYLRGDSQILGRHGLGAQLSYPLAGDVTGSIMVLESLADGSGLISPGLRWVASDMATVIVNAFVPWGSGVRRGQLGSEYGASPHSIYAQLSLYF